eukprot:1334956-Ditylum_brightwellii.AAC.1
MASEQISIYVAKAAEGVDIILDNISLQPAEPHAVGVRDCTTNIIANGNAEAGDHRYWFIRGGGESEGGGEIQIVHPGYNKGDYAFKHTGQRLDRWRGMIQALD